MARPLFDSSSLLHKVAFPAILLAAVCGCEEEKPPLPGDNEVLVMVEGKAITTFDLERALDKSLGEFAAESVERGARDQVLESLVQSKAMAVLGEKGLDTPTRLLIEKEVDSYRESLFVKSYLAKESPVDQITPRDIEKYYNEHAGRFGATVERRYELIFGKNESVGSARVAVMQSLSNASTSEEWKQLASESEPTAPLGYATGRLSEKALHPKLKKLMEGLEMDKASNIAFVQGRPYMGRIIGEEKVPARPLQEVRGDIVKALTAVNLRDAVKRVGEKATEKVRIERLAKPSPKGEKDD